MPTGPYFDMLQVSLATLLNELPPLRTWIEDDDARLRSIGTFYAMSKTLEATPLPDDATDTISALHDGLLGLAQAAMLLAHRVSIQSTEPYVEVDRAQERGKSGRYLPPLEVVRMVIVEALAHYLARGEGMPPTGPTQAELCKEIAEHRLYRVRGNPSGGMSEKTLSRFLGEHGVRYEDVLGEAFEPAMRKLTVLRARQVLRDSAADSA